MFGEAVVVLAVSAFAQVEPGASQTESRAAETQPHAASAEARQAEAEPRDAGVARTTASAAATFGAQAYVSPAQVSTIGAVWVNASHSFENRATVSAFLAGELSNRTFTNEGSLLGYADLGSSFALTYRPTRWEATSFTLRITPFNSARVRESFDFADRWSRLSTNTAGPSVSLSLDASTFRVWGALQGVVMTDPSSVSFFAMSGIAGGAVSFANDFLAELNLGVHNRGVELTLAQQGIHAPMTALGASARVSWSLHGGVSPQTDFTTYANDPARYERFFTWSSYDEASTAAWLGLEGGVTRQNLRDPDTATSMRAVTTGYVDLQARGRFSALRLFGTLRIQPFEFLLFDWPGATALAQSSRPAPFFGAWVGADYRFASVGLEPGLQLRLLEPGSVRGICLDSSSTSCGSTLAGLPDLNFWLLPGGIPLLPVFGAKALLRYHPVPFATVLGEVDYQRESNSLVSSDPLNPRRPAIETVMVRLAGQAQF